MKVGADRKKRLGVSNASGLPLLGVGKPPVAFIPVRALRTASLGYPSSGG
jgi:hypothetical protein